MAKVNDIKDSNYLTKEDCEPAIKVTVSHCAEEDVSMANQPAKMKYVVYFKEQSKGMVLNLTNFQRIVSLCSKDDTDDWQGVQFTLYNDPTVDFGGKLVGGIRVWVPQQTPPDVQQVNKATEYRGDDPPPPSDNDVPPETNNPDWVGDNPPVPPKDGVPY